MRQRTNFRGIHLSLPIETIVDRAGLVPFAYLFRRRVELPFAHASLRREMPR